MRGEPMESLCVNLASGRYQPLTEIEPQFARPHKQPKAEALLRAHRRGGGAS